MRKRILSLSLVITFIVGVFSGCGKESSSSASAAPVILTVAGDWADCRAIEAVGREFTAKYPNCTIVYEFLQDYSNSLKKRMTGEERIDLFFTTNIQKDSEMLPYALDLNSCENLDLSSTFDGLKANFSFKENGIVSDKLYAIPLGAEMRGMYINKTLLNSLNLEVPTDQESLLFACEVLKENGYIPFHGNPSNFAQILVYPWICNIIANADNPQATYDEVESREVDIINLLDEPYEFLYSLIEKDYYNYKKAQTELNLFNETTDKDYAYYFFNIVQNGEAWEKADDIGQVAFMPSTISLRNTIEKTKADYHSQIEYTFVPAPVSDDGGFAYLSPAHGIAANKDSFNLEWTTKFLDFLFQPDNNEIFAEEFNIIPNTKDAFNYIHTLYDIPDDHISHLGQVTFSYDFYNIISSTLLEISKANNPKYMKQNDDGSVSLYSLEYYLDALEESMTKDEE